MHVLRDSVAEVLRDVCPNCGGGFQPQPVRPSNEWRPGVSLAHQPASTVRRHRRDDPSAYADLQSRLEHVPPTAR